jgi:hypothetical protein
MSTVIRRLDADADLAAVVAAYAEASDYWILTDRRPPDAAKAATFFSDGPPGCDPSASYHLGLFVDGQVGGLAELSFGFPGRGDAYLGLIVLAPRLRGAGHGLLAVRRLSRHRPRRPDARARPSVRGQDFKREPKVLGVIITAKRDRRVCLPQQAFAPAAQRALRALPRCPRSAWQPLGEQPLQPRRHPDPNEALA